MLSLFYYLRGWQLLWRYFIWMWAWWGIWKEQCKKLRCILWQSYNPRAMLLIHSFFSKQPGSASARAWNARYEYYLRTADWVDFERVEICTSGCVGEGNYHLTRTELYTSRYLPADLFQLKSNFITFEVKFDHHSGPADWQQHQLVVVARKRKGKMNIGSWSIWMWAH